MSTSAHSPLAHPKRHLMLALCSLCTFINYADRVNISVAIIPIAEQFSYTIEQQSFILSAFFLGNIPMNLGGAILCRRFGGKATLTYGAIFWSLFTILTPISAMLGYYPLILCRVFMGLSEGVAFPAIFHLCGFWVPADERARSIGLILSGVNGGNAVALIVSPLIIEYFNWETIFFIFGAATLLWMMAWQLFAQDVCPSPTSVPTSHLICNDVAPKRVDEKSMFESKVDYMSIRMEQRPLLFQERNITSVTAVHSDMELIGRIFSDRRIVTLCVALSLHTLVFCTILSWLPTYFKKVFQIATGSLWFTCVPYVAMMIAAMMVGWLADTMLHWGITLSRVRKVIILSGSSSAAIMFILFSQMPTVWWALFFMTLAMSCTTIFASGCSTAILDVCKPGEVGTVQAISNTMASLSALLAVPLSTVVLNMLGGSWQMMFASMAAWCFAIGLIFWIFYTDDGAVLEVDESHVQTSGD